MTAASQPDSTALTDLAHRMADASAAVILPYFRVGTGIEDKVGKIGFDPVTAADRDAETVMRAMVEEAHPDHTFIGEEFGTRTGSSDFTWVVDPIDGTRSFIIGVPLWGTLIGLMRGGRPLVGLMNQPFTGERFVAGPEGARYLRAGESLPLRTSATTRIEDAHLGSTNPHLFADGFERGAFERIRDSVRMTRYGGDCYFYCMVAAGHLDLVIECGLNAYDIVGLIPIIESAGGVVTTWEGRPATDGGRIVAAANRELHQKALDLLNA
jgi:histidinol phosphatase-like enzyme (inositol monophosphatase family)